MLTHHGDFSSAPSRAALPLRSDRAMKKAPPRQAGAGGVRGGLCHRAWGGCTAEVRWCGLDGTAQSEHLGPALPPRSASLPALFPSRSPFLPGAVRGKPWAEVAAVVTNRAQGRGSRTGQGTRGSQAGLRLLTELHDRGWSTLCPSAHRCRPVTPQWWLRQGRTR